MTAADINWSGINELSTNIDKIVTDIPYIRTVVDQLVSTLGDSADTSADGTLFGVINNIDTTVAGLDVDELSDAISDLSGLVSDIQDLDLVEIATDIDSIQTVIGAYGDAASAETLFGQFTVVRNTLTALDTIEAAIGNEDDLVSEDTLFGKINDIESFVQLIGAATDTGTTDSLFGKVNSAKTFANDAVTAIKALRVEIGAADKDTDVYEYMENITSIVEKIKSATDSVLMTKLDAETMTKNVVDSLVNAVNESAASLGLKMEDVRSLSEDEAKDLVTVQNKLKEIKEMLEILSSAQEGEGIVVRSWFEVE